MKPALLKLQETASSNVPPERELKDNTPYKEENIEDPKRISSLKNTETTRDNDKSKLIESNESPRINFERMLNKKRFKSLSPDNRKTSSQNQTKKGEKKPKMNRDSCSICRDGGDLILCDNCPKSFHMECLKIKSIDQNSDWYCPKCEPIIQRRKQLLKNKEISKGSKSKSNKKKNPLKNKKTISKTHKEGSSKYKNTKLNDYVKSKNNNVHNKNNNIININVIMNPNNINELGSFAFDSNGNKINQNANKDNNTGNQAELKESQESRFWKAFLSNAKQGLGEVKNINQMSQSNNATSNISSSKSNKQANIKDICTKRKYTKKNPLEKKPVSKEEEEMIKKEIIECPFEKLNDLEYIIENVIRNNFLEIYIQSYIQKSEGHDMSNYINHSKKKKTPNKTKENKSMRSDKLKSSAKKIKKGIAKKILSKKELEKQKRNTEKNKKDEERKIKDAEKKYLSIKWPIEDSELYRNPKLYKVNTQYLVKADPMETFIPKELFMPILRIYDYYFTFHNIVNLSLSFSMEMLYISLLNEEELLSLTGLRENLNTSPLCQDMFISLISLYIEEISSLDSGEFYYGEENQEFEIKLYMIKTSFQNNNTYGKYYYLRHSWTEILYIIISSKKFSFLVDDNLYKLKDKISSLNSVEEFLKKFTLIDKIQILSFLINSSFEFDSIRTKIKEDIDSKTELKKEKNSIEMDLKSLEARKRELERSEKFNKPAEKIEQLNNQLNTLIEDNQHLGRKELYKLRKELENEREDYKGILKELDEIEIRRGKITHRIQKLSTEIRSLSTNSKRCIGKDYFRNEYYMFKSSSETRIHRKDKYGNWGVFTTIEEISNLTDTLCEKAKMEKSLIINIQNINSKNLINERTLANSLEEGLQIFENLKFKENINPLVVIELSKFRKWKNLEISSKDLKADDLDERQYLINLIFDIENKFSDYLRLDDKEWESSDRIEKWKELLKNFGDMNCFKQSIILLNERFKSPYKITINNLPSKRIIDDEEEKIVNHIITDEKSISPYFEDPSRLQVKVKLWSTFNEEIELESEFHKLLEDTLTYPQIIFATEVFTGIASDLFIRREAIKKKYGGGGDIISELSKEPRSNSLLKNSTYSKNDYLLKNQNEFKFEDYMFDEERPKRKCREEKKESICYNYERSYKKSIVNLFIIL